MAHLGSCIWVSVWTWHFLELLGRKNSYNPSFRSQFPHPPPPPLFTPLIRSHLLSIFKGFLKLSGLLLDAFLIFFSPVMVYLFWKCVFLHFNETVERKRTKYMYSVHHLLSEHLPQMCMQNSWSEAFSKLSQSHLSTFKQIVIIKGSCRQLRMYWRRLFWETGWYCLGLQLVLLSFYIQYSEGNLLIY